MPPLNFVRQKPYPLCILIKLFSTDIRLSLTASLLESIKSRQNEPLKRQRLKELKSKEINWSESTRAIEIQKEIVKLESILDKIDGFSQQEQEIMELSKLAQEENDQEMINQVNELQNDLKDDLEMLRLTSLMSHPEDECGCFIEIKSGGTKLIFLAGGDEGDSNLTVGS